MATDFEFRVERPNDNARRAQRRLALFMLAGISIAAIIAAFILGYDAGRECQRVNTPAYYIVIPVERITFRKMDWRTVDWDTMPIDTFPMSVARAMRGSIERNGLGRSRPLSGAFIIEPKPCSLAAGYRP